MPALARYRQNRQAFLGRQRFERVMSVFAYRAQNTDNLFNRSITLFIIIQVQNRN